MELHAHAQVTSERAEGDESAAAHTISSPPPAPEHAQRLTKRRIDLVPDASPRGAEDMALPPPPTKHLRSEESATNEENALDGSQENAFDAPSESASAPVSLVSSSMSGVPSDVDLNSPLLALPSSAHPAERESQSSSVILLSPDQLSPAAHRPLRHPLGLVDSDEESPFASTAPSAQETVRARLNNVTFREQQQPRAAPEGGDRAPRVSFSINQAGRTRNAAPEPTRAGVNALVSRPRQREERRPEERPPSPAIAVDDDDDDLIVTEPIPARPPRPGPPPAYRPPSLLVGYGEPSSSRLHPPRPTPSPPFVFSRADRRRSPSPASAASTAPAAGSSSSSAARERALPASFTARHAREWGGRPRRTPSPPGEDADEALARRLLAEEEAEVARRPAMTDEELARHLQAEEERTARARSRAALAGAFGYMGGPRFAGFEADDFEDGFDFDTPAAALSDAFGMHRAPSDFAELERRAAVRRAAAAAAAAAAGEHRSRHRYSGEVFRRLLQERGFFGGMGGPWAGPTAEGRDARLLSLAFVDRDFTADDYEMLLRLDEGAGAKKGAAQATIDRLPQTVHRVGDETLACCICMSDAEPGEAVRRLCCAHAFHRDCVDKWLRESSWCPVCKLPIE